MFQLPSVSAQNTARFGSGKYKSVAFNRNILIAHRSLEAHKNKQKLILSRNFLLSLFSDIS